MLENRTVEAGGLDIETWQPRNVQIAKKKKTASGPLETGYTNASDDRPGPLNRKFWLRKNPQNNGNLPGL